MQDGLINRKQITPPDSKDLMRDVITKIAACENILIALSRNPAVDEIAAAIGLAIFLEEAGKRVTAIYSGETPNVLEFLKPEKTLETNVDSLQDFIVALDKEKADHLRYKIDGDYVKVYITPYKTKLEEEDLEFSYGDYNVDLVIALNVPTASDLDAALSEHGRIMHDASTIDVTVTEPGRFAEIEWSDTSYSSVSEMIANLLMAIKKPEVKKDVATALLTGIVAATNRFSNDNTKSCTMVMASKLMDCGASEQLVAMNMMENTPAELIGAVDLNSGEKTPQNKGDGVLSVEHSNDEEAEAIKAEILNATGEVTKEEGSAEQNTNPDAEQQPMPDMPSEIPAEQTDAPKAEVPNLDYSKMMEEALAESLPTADQPLEVSTENPAAAMAPEVPPMPEENHIPEMQYTATTEPVANEGMIPAPADSAPMDSPVPMSGSAPMSGPAYMDTAPTMADGGLSETPASQGGVEEGPYTFEESRKTIAPLPMPDESGTLPPPPTPDLNFDAVPPMSSEMPSETPVLPNVQPMAEAPIATPAEQPMAMPMDQPMMRPSEQPMMMPMDQPIVQPSEQPMATPADQPPDAFQIPNF